MFKHFVYLATQKIQPCRSDYIYIQIYKNYYIFSFLCSSLYKEFCIKYCILVGYIIYYV
jgi:hypothetical protein